MYNNTDRYEVVPTKILIMSEDSNGEPPTPISLTPKTKSVKPKKKGKIIYPIFLEACEFVDDEYWYEVLQNIAYGKFLTSFTIRDNKFYYRVQNEYFNIGTNPEELADTTINFIRTKANVNSLRDQIKQKESNMVFLSNLESKTINPLTNKNNRQDLFYAYAYDIIDRMNLDRNLVHQLVGILNLAYFSNILSKNDIEIIDNKITNIKHLCWNPDKNMFFINPEQINKCLNKKTKNNYNIIPQVSNSNNNRGVNINQCWEEVVNSVMS